MKHAYGNVEDIKVKVESFIFLVDFIVITSLVLSRLFLLTCRFVIDQEYGTLTLKLYDKIVKLNVLRSMEHK